MSLKQKKHRSIIVILSVHVSYLEGFCWYTVSMYKHISKGWYILWMQVKENYYKLKSIRGKIGYIIKRVLIKTLRINSETMHHY